MNLLHIYHCISYQGLILLILKTLTTLNKGCAPSVPTLLWKNAKSNLTSLKQLH